MSYINPNMINYHMEILDNKKHYLRGYVYIPYADAKGHILKMPNWSPGSYKIRDYAKDIISLECYDDTGLSYEMKQIDKSTWQLPPNQRPLEVKYTLYCFDLSPRTNYIDQYMALINPVATLLQVDKFEDTAVSMTITHPIGWDIKTSLLNNGSYDMPTLTVQVDNFGVLIDSPILIGNLKTISFDVSGVPHHFVFTNLSEYYDFVDSDLLANDLKEICSTQINIFKDNKLSGDYYFLTILDNKLFGGLEHLNSSILIAPLDSLPNRVYESLTYSLNNDKPVNRDKSYLKLLSLCSHEYFHRWNVKSIKNKDFMTNDYQEEKYSSLLWFFEGFTEYYGYKTLVKAKIISEKDYLDEIAKKVSSFLKCEGRKKLNIKEISFNTWTKFYQASYNAPNSFASYYTHGALIALVLDMYLIDKSNTEVTLDNLMHNLWEQYQTYLTPVDERTITIALENLLTGAKDYLENLLEDKNDLIIAELKKNLLSQSIELSLVPSSNTDEIGGYGEPNKALDHLDIGAHISTNNQGWEISSVLENSNAENAGLAAGDTIIAVNRIQVLGTNIEALLKYKSSFSNVKLSYFRKGILHNTQLNLHESHRKVCYIKHIEKNKK